jgi:hypothetical protein
LQFAVWGTFPSYEDTAWKTKRPLKTIPRAVHSLKSLQSIGDAYKMVHGMVMLDEHSKGFSEDSQKLVSLESDELPISDDPGIL